MDEIKEQKDKKTVQQRIMAAFLAIAFVMMLSVGPVAAVDWTNITALIDGITGILPAITNLISAIVEPIIVLSVVGFLVGMLNGLLGGLESALRFGR